MFIVAAFVAIGAATTVAATVLAVATLVSYVGIAMTLVGLVTGSEKLMKWGGILSMAGGIVSLATGAITGATTTAVADGAIGEVAGEVALGGASGSAVPYIGAEGVGTVAETSFGTLAGEQTLAATKTAEQFAMAERASALGAEGFSAPAEALAAPARAPLLGTELSADFVNPYIDQGAAGMGLSAPSGGLMDAPLPYTQGQNAGYNFGAPTAAAPTAAATANAQAAAGAPTNNAVAQAGAGQVGAGQVGTGQVGTGQVALPSAAPPVGGAALSPFEKFSTFATNNKDLLTIGTQVFGGAFAGMNRTAEFNEYAALRRRELDMRQYGNTVSRFQPRGLIGATA